MLFRSTTAGALLGDGRNVSGKVSFVGSAADPQSRTYRVEITVPNADHSIRGGLTADLRIPNRTVLAHRISPAVLALDDAGGVGVRILDARRMVRMLPVKVIKNDPKGVWVTGLPEVATVITVGQEMVVAGESVDVTFEAPDVPDAVSPAGAQIAAPAVSTEPAATEPVATGPAVSNERGTVGTAAGAPTQRGT